MDDDDKVTKPKRLINITDLGKCYSAQLYCDVYLASHVGGASYHNCHSFAQQAVENFDKLFDEVYTV